MAIQQDIWRIQIWSNYLHRHKSICPLFKKNLFLWLNFSGSHQIATSKGTRFSLSCITIHQKIYQPVPYKATPLFKYKHSRMPFLIPSVNLCQQTRCDHYTRNSNHNITTSLNFSSHMTHILNMPQKKKVVKGYKVQT